jgi:hypothetical protein
MPKTSLLLIFFFNGLLFAQFSFPIKRAGDVLDYNGPKLFVIEEGMDATEPDVYSKSIYFRSIYNMDILLDHLTRFNQDQNKIIKRFRNLGAFAEYHPIDLTLVNLNFSGTKQKMQINFSQLMDYLTKEAPSWVSNPRFLIYPSYNEEETSSQQFENLFNKELGWFENLLFEYNMDTTVIGEWRLSVDSLGQVMGEAADVFAAFTIEKLNEEQRRFPVLKMNNKPSGYNFVFYNDQLIEKIVLRRFETNMGIITPIWNMQDSVYLFRDTSVNRTYLVNYKSGEQIRELDIKYGWLDSALNSPACRFDINFDGLIDFVYAEAWTGSTKYHYVLNGLYEYGTLFTTQLLPKGYYIRVNNWDNGQKHIELCRLIQEGGYHPLLTVEFKPLQKCGNSNPYEVPVCEGNYHCKNQMDTFNPDDNYVGNDEKKGQQAYQNILNKIQFYLSHPQELPD